MHTSDNKETGLPSVLIGPQTYHFSDLFPSNKCPVCYEVMWLFEETHTYNHF